MKRLKKVFKAAVGVLCAVSVLCLTCINAFASAGVLAGGAVITLLAYLLVSSGAATQSQVNTMSNSGIIEMAQTNVEILPSAFPTAPDSLVNKAFIEAAADAADITKTGFSILDFVINHLDDVSTVGSFDMGGFGCYYGSGLCDDLHPPAYGCNHIFNTFGAYGVIDPSDGYAWIYSGSGQIKNVFLGQLSFENKSVVTARSGVGALLDGECMYGDWRYLDGTPADDYISVPADVPSAIGTVDIGGETYDVNADGTVTVGDTTYTINNDGSVTVNEGDDINTYSPTYNFEVYDDSAIQDLIQDLIDTADSTKDEVSDEAQAAVNAEIMDFTLSPTISTVFPFCIPWDFVRGMKLLAIEPEAPRFEVPFDLPEFGLFPGSENTVVIDFEEYSKYFNIVRWVFYLIFCFGLCFLSFKIIKGNH